MLNAVVVGAGVWGCTVARILAERGQKVLILEKRSRLGGNCCSEYDQETGIEVHLYGSHIFHTSNPQVWRFVNRFAEFNTYKHVVLANHNGNLYHLPIGKTLFREFGTDDMSTIIDTFVKGYTEKQWGISFNNVDPSVIRRLRVRADDSNRYFDDKFEGIPVDGYNALFERMIDHPNIEVRYNANVELSDIKSTYGGVRTYYSGPLDGLFGYCCGELPWRSLRFEFEKLETERFQSAAVVNFVDPDIPYTRVHEFKHYHPECIGSKGTIICREYPRAWEPGLEPYYPVRNGTSDKLYAEYLKLAKEYDNLVVGGRLGGFEYLDMDKAIERAFTIVQS